jgi:TatA/E family protein of Tat protein translocase
MPFNIQGPELIIILIIALIVIGPGKLPDVGSALGRSIKEFRKAASDVKDSTSLESPAQASGPVQTAPPPAISAPAAPSISTQVPSAPPLTVETSPAAPAASEASTSESETAAANRASS